MQEEWRPVVGYEGLYEVSNIGRVKSLDRVTVDILGRSRPFKGKMMSPVVGSPRYYGVGLTKNGKSKPIRIHQLVAEAFLTKAHHDDVVDHIDRDKLNNSIANLRYITKRENTIHGSLSEFREDKTSKYVGVTRTSDGKYWQSYKVMDGKRHYLGSYKKEEHAAKAYQEGRKLYKVGALRGHKNNSLDV